MEKPRSPTSIFDHAAAAVALVVTARRGLVVRAGVELKSAEVAKLDKGVRCLVTRNGTVMAKDGCV